MTSSYDYKRTTRQFNSTEAILTQRAIEDYSEQRAKQRAARLERFKGLFGGLFR